MLPEGSRDSSRAELFFEDLDKLVPEDVARICEWLTEKVDGFSAKLKPEAKEIQEVRFWPWPTQAALAGISCTWHLTMQPLHGLATCLITV